MITRQGTKSSILLTAAAIVSAVGLLSGCSAAAPKAAPTKDTKLSSEEYMIALRKCMSAEGVDLKWNSDGSAVSSAVSFDGSTTQGKMVAAMNACQKKLGTPPEAEKATDPQQAKDQLLKAAKCLRENGVDSTVSDGALDLKGSELPEAVAKTCLGVGK
ncbi:hypothetical protein ATY41_04840 [Leifsonia xyli subsp. xyli]|uniref:Secreted protein n=2 Tax=Leifsonia xyli subsp. xyli TaxID=59736 RepID=Q6ACK6_LEIXX|nr:hypothetical protein [Leifsonia xyli]AAT89887.1 hypothetical protein Lxx22020 [Leifsonia xyli subsp. xyli str. CTCB07]ODA89604.1 hypothetical protein ATY41_04840 [Leifsonia xyli subsp. xyli]